MKHWTPSKPTVALKPSRIRRDPPLQAVAKAAPISREREVAGGVAGILLVAAALATAIIGISASTLFREDPNAAAEASHFGQCYNAPGPNCVIDGATIYAAGERLTIAGIDVPSIQDARCDDERDRGIEAAVRLADLLNSGRVAVGPTVADDSGHLVRAVSVDGKDIAKPMIKEGLARKPGSETPGWCTSPSSDG